MILHVCKDSYSVRVKSIAFLEADPDHRVYRPAVREVEDLNGGTHKVLSASKDNLALLQGLNLSAVDITFDPSTRDEVVFCLRAFARIR